MVFGNFEDIRAEGSVCFIEVFYRFWNSLALINSSKRQVRRGTADGRFGGNQLPYYPRALL